MVIRLLDILISVFFLILVLPIFTILFIILFFDVKSPIFIQKRVGKAQSSFNLYKLRTMRIGAPTVGTHEIDTNVISNTGMFLRKFKLDELPQLINVIFGQMSLVGPRPCLSIQYKVISEREKRNVFKVRPGITGLAQINEIDMSKPVLLAETDSKMIDSFNTKKYFHILFLTCLGKGKGDRVKDIK